MGGSAGDFVGGVGDALTGGRGATRDAINAQTDAAREANATQKYIYDEQRKDAQPWADAGKTALSQLADSDFKNDFTDGMFQADPGYAFRMAEGQKAIERSAAARGGLNSGATLKALTRFGQDTASSEYQNAYNRYNADRDRRFNRLSSIAGIGQTANGQVQNASMNYGNQVSQNQMGLGNAIGSAYIGNANRMTDFLGGTIKGGASFAGSMVAGGKGKGDVQASDERVKENIVPVSKEDLKELRSVIKPYAFNYINESFGSGDWIGVMAQDLEKSKLGRMVVFEDTDGVKKIDMRKMMSLFMATMAEG